MPATTSAFAAMKDFTKNGISVESLQTEYYAGFSGGWAVPNVRGIAEALGTMATNATFQAGLPAMQQDAYALFTFAPLFVQWGKNRLFVLDRHYAVDMHRR